MEADPPNPPKRKPGRPKGSRNKAALERPDPRAVPMHLVFEDRADYRHADPGAIVSRQLTLLDWAQQAVRNEMRRAMQATGVRIEMEDVKKLESMSNAIVRAMDAMKKSTTLAEALAEQKTPAELLELALRKIEGQDLSTLNYAIKRLRAHRERIAPLGTRDKMQMGMREEKATDAIASLEDE